MQSSQQIVQPIEILTVQIAPKIEDGEVWSRLHHILSELLNIRLVWQSRRRYAPLAQLSTKQ